MSTKMKTNNSANSICIPRAFANISEARVRKIFDALNIFVIDRIDMIQRKNEKGEPFQRIFIHIREWSETADARKAKDRLLAGKELKIVYDDPWFWKVSLNTWTQKPAPNPSLYDRKPRIRIDFDEDAKNVNAAAALLGSLDLVSEDQRPYSERRLDPVYCAHDQEQGFRDRRINNEPRYQPRSPSSSPPRRRENIVFQPVTSIAPALPETVEIVETVERDQGLVVQMKHAFRCEITDEIYLANMKNVRDQIHAEQNRPVHFTVDNLMNDLDYKKEDGTALEVPKKKTRKII